MTEYFQWQQCSNSLHATAAVLSSYNNEEDFIRNVPPDSVLQSPTLITKFQTGKIPECIIC